MAERSSYFFCYNFVFLAIKVEKSVFYVLFMTKLFKLPRNSAGHGKDTQLLVFVLLYGGFYFLLLSIYLFSEN